MEKVLSYAMVGGAEGSFIGPVHRMAVGMDGLAVLAAGAFSRSPERNAATGAALGIDPGRVYPSWREMIAGEKGKVDFISVCTPNSSHFEITRAALEAGFDVMCEKPVSLTAAEAEELSRIARRGGRIVAVPFTYTGFPMVKLAKDLVAAGEIGRIAKISVEYHQGSFRKLSAENARRTAWKMDPAVSGRSCVTADIGVHGFELVEYVSGLKVEKVLADVSSFVHEAGLDDDAAVLMRLEGGAKAVLSVSKIAAGEENGLRIRFYGEKGSLFWDQENPNSLVARYPLAPDRVYRRKGPLVSDISPLAAAAVRTPAGHNEGFIEAFANIYRNFCRSVISRKAGDFPTVEDGARAMRFVEAVLDSGENGNIWMKV